MFYDRFAYLCSQLGVSPSRAAIDAGISKSLVTKWKTNATEIPSPEVLGKLSKYFGIPVSELLGEETEKTPAENSKRLFISYAYKNIPPEHAAFLQDMIDKGMIEEGKPREVTEYDIKVALFHGSEEVTDEMYEEVKNFAAFVAQREAAKKDKG